MTKIIDFILLVLSILFIALGMINLQTKVVLDTKCPKRSGSIIFNDFKSLEHSIKKSVPSFDYYKKQLTISLLPHIEENSTKVVVKKDVNFLLIGTTIFDDKKGAIFYLQKERKCSPYYINDEIDGWKIVDIKSGKVSLSSGGKSMDIELTDKNINCKNYKISRIVNPQVNKPIVLDSAPSYIHENKENINTHKTSSPTILKPTKKTAQKLPINKNKENKNRPKSKNRSIKTNPFLELLKKMKKKGNTNSPSHGPTSNPFLEIIKRHQNK